MEKNTKIIPVEAPVSLIEQWSAAAKTEGLSRAQWVRMACNAYAGLDAPEIVKRGRPRKTVENPDPTNDHDPVALADAADKMAVTDDAPVDIDAV
jgi:hypothetical protein